MMQLASDVGPAPWQVGAVLRLGARSSWRSPDQLADLIASRLGRVRRLRQVLRRTPFGAGRPVWVDQPDFDVRRHLQLRRCPAPADEAALLDLAPALVSG